MKNTDASVRGMKKASNIAERRLINNSKITKIVMIAANAFDSNDDICALRYVAGSAL